ncbi:MAG: carboxymuconolactone decarboxylase family protein [Rhodobacter sp.]|nr:carboxymuconolactone decarboxylase family protein [Rhodobacter sp.]MBK8440540.1 carboxymuconolactone decarboxylase family protein [Rhodobacter sp.]
MEQRLDYQKVDPAAYRAVLGLENHLHGPAGLEPQLIHLLKLRASQMNGCAYCVDMHTKEARKDGLSEQWIALVCVWREALVFQPRERALLAWTEALTRMGEAGAPDELYQAMRAHFSERDTVNLTVAIATINVWNRLAVGFRSAHPLDAGA